MSKVILSDYATKATGLVIVAGVVVVGALATAGVIDRDTKDTAINLLIGFLVGGASAVFGKRA